MLRLPDSWVWDFWFADDGEQHHLFFLYASRALHDPDARHYRASIGHAVSDDLVHWTRVDDALVRSDAGAFDDLATWTGSVVQHPDGTWFLFYTGATLEGGKNVQRIGYATSHDLLTWTKATENPVLAADPRWYETLADGQWHDEAFRDPWVLADPAGDGWHMLITARGRAGDAFERGLVGHAWSPDLREWELRAPLSAPGHGFGQLEVTQVEEVDGKPVLIFSCLAADMPERRRAETGGGVWAVPAESLLGPFDVANAYPLTGREHYSGKLVRDRSGAWRFMAFDHDGPDGAFAGTICDPLPVAWEGERLVVRH